MVNLLPRDHSFENMFSEMAGYLIQGAELLQRTLQNGQDVEKRVVELKEIEHKCDDLTHSILVRLHQTFITPFDREDIHALASSLDDVLDFIYAAGERLTTYGITNPPASAAIIAGIIGKQAQQLQQAVSRLNKHQEVLNHCVEINRLENEA
ncbi:MAG TPA: DUF47 family protein, partial [Terriglobales bacterium]